MSFHKSKALWPGGRAWHGATSVSLDARVGVGVPGRHSAGESQGPFQEPLFGPYFWLLWTRVLRRPTWRAGVWGGTRTSILSHLPARQALWAFGHG